MSLRLLLLPFLLLTACADGPDAPADDGDTLSTLVPEVDTAATPASMPDEADAVAVLDPTEGNTANGRVTFTNVEGGVRVLAEISGLSEGLHGIHIHETGDCSAPDASSAGGHYAPDGSPHGAPDDPPSERHAGDLGNIEAGSGTARYERVDPVIQLSGPSSILGKAVIVHAGQDDFTSQPSGDAGSRLVCGVIDAR